MPTKIRRIRDTGDPAVESLVKKSDEYLDSLYPPESNHAEPISALVAPGAAFFGLYVDDKLAACGAVKILSDTPPYGEIKRVFVDSDYRGRGFAVIIMRHLEDFVSDNGLDLVRLEAGPAQPAAISLYQKLGYSMRGPFGQYRPDPLSVFMEKTLR